FSLSACPACGRHVDPASSFRPLDSDCFNCTCDDCGTTWGLRLCSKGHRFATMLPNGRFVETTASTPGWHDRVYGSDLLALPDRTGEGNWGFVCPVCGVVG